MPIHEVQTAFNAGELTDKIAARVDTQKYRFGAECLKNWVCVPQGGISSRAGTIFIAEAKYRDKLFVLGKFEFSTQQAYALEIGEGYIRFYANRARLEVAGVPVEVETPYTEDDLRALRYEQSADVMWFAHRSHPVHKLERVSATEFRFVPVRWTTPPTYEAKTFFDADLTLSATTGLAQTVTSSIPLWIAGDVGRTIESGGGAAVITALTSSTLASIDIRADFTSTTLASGDWNLTGSPQTDINVEFGSAGAPGARKTAKTYFHDGVNADGPTSPGFRSSDVGKYIIVGGGVFKITEYVASDEVFVTINKTATQIPSARAGGWTLESESWTEANGYPGVVRLHEQRLWFFGSPQFPDTAWGSITGDYENFARGAKDDDALEFTIAESGVNLIRWALSVPEGLALGTIASEVTLEGSNDSAITLTSIRIRPRTDWGSDHDVDALRVDHALLFLQRGAVRVREFSFDFASNTYSGIDLNALSEHITKPGVVQMAYAKTPESIVFAVRSDGVLLALTYERAQEVVGWSHHETDGDFETVTAIPNMCGTADEVWVGVRRPGIAQGSWWHRNWWATGWWQRNWWAGGTGERPRGHWFPAGWFSRGWFAAGWFGGVDEGTARRYIEVFDGSMTLDSGLVYEGEPSDTFDGLGHLEGKSVTAITDDGAVHTVAVSDGSISLPKTTRLVQAGLRYACIAKTLRPELQTPLGTAQGRRKRWNSVQLRVYCTEGRLKVNDEALQFPEDARVPFTGDLRPQTASGWSSDGQHTIVLDEPKKATILDFKGSLQVDDGAR